MLPVALVAICVGRGVAPIAAVAGAATAADVGVGRVARAVAADPGTVGAAAVCCDGSHVANGRCSLSSN